ncbi:cytochrome P450 [Pseudoprimorskyibacter insulae]|uniref:Cytochrome p450 CYP199A2 n=1 Tax=Pseudoprimorskyibacter insulae TaxID=1695997 RepID=A0A2R8AYI8_9RHOB|nr:cytochrome P450 [Pseudoprimorskyibacter insulae]SPF80939.1 Cytochrome p450 CYP199A2 [Pseudoprimorskyibacter insulae]
MTQVEIIEGHRKIDPPPGVPVWDVDPYDEAILRDPHAFYAELRRLGDFVYIPKYSVLAMGRFSTVREVFSDHTRFLSSHGVGLDDYKLIPPYRPPSIILEVDPPDHTKTRKILTRALSPKVVRGLMDMFLATAEPLIDDLIARGPFEGVEDFAEVFPTSVFPIAVGMSNVSARHLVDYGAMVFNAVGPNNALRQAAFKAAEEIVPIVTRACQRDALSKDGLGALVYQAADAGEITEDEAGMLVRSFFSAGVDTTVTGIGNAMYCFGQFPDQWEALKRDPTQIRAAFEEILRFTSPVHTFGRTAGVDTEVAGTKIEAGTKIICVLGAANSDPEKWGDPEVFRIDRKPVGHVAFGAGIHGCVGQNIARGELEAVLSVMLRKVDRIEFTGAPEWRPNNAICALDKLPMQFIGK